MPEKSPLQPISSDELTSLLDFVGNHEVKVGLGAIFLGHPNEVFTGATLRTEVRQSQGEEPAWVPAQMTLENHCRDGLEPGGVVIVDRKYEGPALYAATNKNPQRKLAFIGTILGWSLDFPETSVRKLFGTTSLLDGFRAPESRYRIYKAIMEYTGPEMSFGPLVKEVSDERIKPKSVARTIEALAAQNILETHILDTTTDITLEIVSPDYTHITKPFEDLKPVTKAAYKAIRTLWDQGRKTISFDDLLEHALEIDPNIDLVAFRYSWHAGSHKQSFPGLRQVSRAIHTPRQKSAVRFHPAHVEAITTLMDRLQALQTNPEQIRIDGELALSILRKSSAMSHIFAKAWRFSAYNSESSAATGENVVAIVRQAESISAVRVKYELAEIEGRTLTIQSIYRLLDQLVKAGTLTYEEVQEDPTKQRKVRYYRLVEEEPDTSKHRTQD